MKDCFVSEHVGNGEFFEGDEVVGVEGGSHDGGRILYLGVVGKEKSPTVATMRLFVRVNFTSIRW